jgi:hypothetical protein
MKAVVDMKGDWKTSIQNHLYQNNGKGGCIFSDVKGYWATDSTWQKLSSGESANYSGFTPICTISEFEEAASKWKEQQTLGVPKVNYDELTFGELPRDEQLKLVEHVLDGGVVEWFHEDSWTYVTPLSKGLYFCNDREFRIKHINPLTEKELFLREAKHYESIEQMFDSGKFKLVANDGEE